MNDQTKLKTIKNSLFLTLEDIHSISKEDWNACFITKGKRKGFLRDTLKGDHPALALLLALKLESNPYKFDVGRAMFLRNDAKTLFQELTVTLGKVSKWVAFLDYDRSALEALNVW